MNETEKQQSVSLWLISLAISIVCCAILFVIFAGFFIDVKDSISANTKRFDMMDERLTIVIAELQAMRKTLPSTAAAPAAPASASTQSPEPTPPVVTVPTVGASQADVTTPAVSGVEPPPSTTVTPTTPNAPITPPPAAATSIPELPAKK